MYYRRHGCGPWGGGDPRNMQTPPVNITETDQSFTIYLFAPSLQKENINVNMQNDILTVTYKGSVPEQGAQFRRKEYRPEEMQRSFDLKGKVDIDGIHASYAEGIITIELPKSEKARQPARDVAVN